MADVPNVIPDVARRQHNCDSGDRGADALYVRVSDTILEDEALVGLFRNLLFVRRLDAAQNDILAAEIFYLFLGFEAGPFADGQHRDHRANTEDYTQDREQGTKAMHPKAANAKTEAAPQAGKGERGQRGLRHGGGEQKPK